MSCDSCAGAVSWPGLSRGKAEVERRTAPDSALGPHLSAVPLHDLAHAGETDTDTWEFDRPMQSLEWRKELMDIRGVEAGAVVPNEQQTNVRLGGLVPNSIEHLAAVR